MNDWYRKPLCVNCKKPLIAHIKDKCLFDTTYYQEMTEEQRYKYDGLATPQSDAAWDSRQEAKEQESFFQCLHLLDLCEY